MKLFDKQVSHDSELSWNWNTAKGRLGKMAKCQIGQNLLCQACSRWKWHVALADQQVGDLEGELQENIKSVTSYRPKWPPNRRRRRNTPGHSGRWSLKLCRRGKVKVLYILQQLQVQATARRPNLPCQSSTLCRVFASTLVVGFSLLPGHAEYPPKPRFGGEVCDVWLVWRKNRMFLRHLKACGCWLWRVLTQRPRQAIDGFRETTWRAGYFLPTFALQDAHGRTQGPQDVWFCKILRSDQCSDDSSRAKRFKSRHSGLYSMHSSVEMLRCLQCAFPGCDALSLATCFGWRIAADIWAAWAVACAGCWKHFYGFDIESSRLVLENEFLHLELKPAQSYLEKRKTWFVWVLQDVLIPLI